MLLVSSLLEEAWTHRPGERSSLARAFIELGGGSEQGEDSRELGPSAPPWLLAGVGRALEILAELAEEALEQEKGRRWRARLFGSRAPETEQEPMPGFASFALEELRSRMASLLGFAERWGEGHAAALRDLLPADLDEGAEGAAEAWVVLSCAIVADADRSYRGEGDVELIERWLFGGGFRSIPPMAWRSDPASARRLLSEARGTDEEEMYDSFERFVRARGLATRLVERGLLRSEEIDLILALGPAESLS